MDTIFFSFVIHPGAMVVWLIWAAIIIVFIFIGLNRFIPKWLWVVAFHCYYGLPLLLEKFINTFFPSFPLSDDFTNTLNSVRSLDMGRPVVSLLLITFFVFLYSRGFMLKWLRVATSYYRYSTLLLLLQIWKKYCSLFKMAVQLVISLFCYAYYSVVLFLLQDLLDLQDSLMAIYFFLKQVSSCWLNCPFLDTSINCIAPTSSHVSLRGPSSKKWRLGLPFSRPWFWKLYLKMNSKKERWAREKWWLVFILRKKFWKLYDQRWGSKKARWAREKQWLFFQAKIKTQAWAIRRWRPTSTFVFGYGTILIGLYGIFVLCAASGLIYGQEGTEHYLQLLLEQDAFITQTPVEPLYEPNFAAMAEALPRDYYTFTPNFPTKVKVKWLPWP